MVFAPIISGTAMSAVPLLLIVGMAIFLAGNVIAFKKEMKKPKDEKNIYLPIGGILVAVASILMAIMPLIFGVGAGVGTAVALSKFIHN